MNDVAMILSVENELPEFFTHFHMNTTLLLDLAVG